MPKFARTFTNLCEKQQKKLGRALSDEEIRRLEAELIDAWIAERHFDELIRHIHATYELEGGLVQCIVLGKALREAGEVERVHTLFRGLLSSRARAFWRCWPGAANGQIAYMRDSAKYMASCMETYSEYWHNLWVLGLRTASEALKLEMLQMQARTAPPAVSARQRGMSERVFWNLIDNAASDAGSAGQFAVNLETALASYAAADIRQFADILARKLSALDSWDLFAFARLAGGFRDEPGFAGFRAWLITRGRKCFEAAKAGPAALVGHFVPTWHCRCNELFEACQDAYRSACGGELPEMEINLAVRSGEPWRDDRALFARYPELARQLEEISAGT